MGEPGHSTKKASKQKEMGFSLDGYRAEASALIYSGVNGGYKKAAIVVSSRDIRNAGNKQKTAFLLSVLRN